MRNLIFGAVSCLASTAVFAQDLQPTDQEVYSGLQACHEAVQATGVGPASAYTWHYPTSGDWSHCPVLEAESAKRKAAHDAAVNLQKSQDIARRLQQTP